MMHCYAGCIYADTMHWLSSW